MSIKTILVTLFMSLSVMLQAQIRLSGEVTHGDDGIPGVTIKVVEQGDVLRTLMANRRGRYETTIPFNKQYTLVFYKPFMYPVSIEIDSRVDFSEEVLYDVPLNMKMFYRFDGIDEKPFEQPIGVVKQTGDGVSAFSFIPDEKVIYELKTLQSRSLLEEEQGADPVDQERLEKEMKAFTISEPEPKPEADRTEPRDTSIILKPNPDRERGAVKPKEESESTALHAQTKRFDVVETSKEIEKEVARSSKSNLHDSKARLQSEQNAHFHESKTITHEQEVTEARRIATIADARVSKHEKYASQLSAERNQQIPSDKSLIQVVKVTLDEGSFVQEERLLVDMKGNRHEFKKSTYNWVLFDLVYYSKDDLEISKDEYEAVRALVDI